MHHRQVILLSHLLLLDLLRVLDRALGQSRSWLGFSDTQGLLILQAYSTFICTRHQRGWLL